MAIFDLYSKRRKLAEAGEAVDVFQYDNFPRHFRVQVIYIWKEILPTPQRDASAHVWERICNIISREYGLFRLTEHQDYFSQCANFFLEAEESDKVLDMVELVFWYASFFQKENSHNLNYYNIIRSAADGIIELNDRFREHGIGYEFDGGNVIRVDSQVVHEEIVKPALRLLRDARFERANHEFIEAHKHYRTKDPKSCVVACLRCFESLLKAICDDQGWTYGSGDTATSLITKVRQEGLFPNYLGKSFDAYIAMMKTGLPDIRNNAGGHGESGSTPPIPSYIPEYAIYMTATNVLMLTNAFHELK